MKQKGLRGTVISLAVVILLTLILIAAYLILRRSVIVGWHLYPRNQQTLDLRAQTLSVQDYNLLSWKLPETDILWNVPFQNSYLSSDIQELTLTQVDDDTVAMLAFFPQLQVVHAEQCTDYPGLAALWRQYPQLDVRYSVPLDTQTLPSSCTEAMVLTLDDETAAMLDCLPRLTRVTVATCPDEEQIGEISRRHPDWAVDTSAAIDGVTVTAQTRSLDLSDRQLDFSTVVWLAEHLSQLETVDLRDCSLTQAEMMELSVSFPDCFFLWQMQLGTAQFLTDAEEIDLSGVELDSTQPVEELLDYLPNLKRVIMCSCGLDDETMDALNRRYADIRFVWSVQIGIMQVRTDATFFYPFVYERQMGLKDLRVDEADLYPLRYCTDMIAIDIGHMTYVTTCEWAAFMPNLKYLILAETAITDLTPLSNLKNLVFLEIFTTNITDYSPLLGCTALEDLNLGNTYGDPAPIAKMTWLKNLWWSGIQGTYGLPCSDAPALLAQALPNTTMKFNLETPNANNGWRQLDNYKAMRDLMGVFYLT